MEILFSDVGVNYALRTDLVDAVSIPILLIQSSIWSMDKEEMWIYWS